MSMAGPEATAFDSNSSRFAAMAAVNAFLISLASLPIRGFSSFGSLPSCSNAADTEPLRPRYLALSWSSAGRSTHVASAASASVRADCSCCSSSVMAVAETVTKPAPSRKKRFGRGQHLFDGNEFHAFHENGVHAMALEARGARNAGAQDYVLFAVGAGQGRIGGTEYADHRCADSGGDVHRPAVIGDDDSATAVEFRELEEGGLPGEITATLGDSANRVAFAAGAGEDNPFAR